MVEKNLLFSVCPDAYKNSIIEAFREEVLPFIQQNQTKESEEYLTAKEVAEWLKCDAGTVYNWTKKGKITKYCLGNKSYYKKSEIEKAIIPLKINS